MKETFLIRFYRLLSRLLPKLGKPEPAKPWQPTRCGTPWIRKHSKDPSCRFGLAYKQADGSVIIEYIYPYDGRREIEAVPKEEREKQGL